MNARLKKLYQQLSGNSRMALSASARQRVKDQVFQRLAERPGEEAEAPISLWARIRHSLLMKSYVLVPLVLVLFIASTAAASAHALPGDVLYLVKRQVEHTRVLLAPSAEAKLELELNFAEERLLELEKVQASGNVQAELRSKSSKSGNGQDNNNGGATNDADSAGNNKDDNSKNTDTSKNRSSNKREIRARQQAEGALDFLEKTRKQYQEHKDNRRAQDMDKKIENYRNRLYKNDNDESGSQRKKSDFLRGAEEKLQGSPDADVRVDLDLDANIR